MRLSSKDLKSYGKLLGVQAKVKLPNRKGIDPELFCRLCEAQGLPRPVAEYPFCKDRKWRFDFVFPERIALEIEGSVWVQGRHTRGSGFVADMEKYNAATLCGWRLIRCTPQMIEDGSVFTLLRRALS